MTTLYPWQNADLPEGAHSLATLRASSFSAFGWDAGNTAHLFYFYLCACARACAARRLRAGARPLFVVGLVDAELTSSPADTANRLADTPAFPVQPVVCTAKEAELLLHNDSEHGVAYITLSAAASVLARAPEILAAASDYAAHARLTDRASERALTVLFHLCHVVLLVHPGRCADVRLLRTLRTLATVKQDIQPAVAASLKPLASQLQPHRQATPPALPLQPTLGFVFSAGHPHTSEDAAVLQSALEAQVRKLLASSKQLARCAAGGASALYSLPMEQQRCVHLEPPQPRTPQPQPAGVGDAEACDVELFGQLVALLAVDSATETAQAGSATASHGLSGWKDALQLDHPPSASASAAASIALRRFVARLADGNYCQVTSDGALAAGTSKELPSATQWSLVCRQLLERAFRDDAREDAPSGTRAHAHPDARLPPASSVTRMLDAETAFSLSRGHAVLPAALEVYAHALPSQYTRLEHERRVSAAELHVTANVVGPAREATLTRLRRVCQSTWQAGGQECDAVSSTGRPSPSRVRQLPTDGAEPAEGLAAASGLLRLGDKLLAVNDVQVRGHARATAALKGAEGQLRLSILREDSDQEQPSLGPYEVDIVLHKPRLSSKLGIILSSASKDSGVPTITGLGTTSGTSAAASNAPMIAPIAGD